MEVIQITHGVIQRTNGGYTDDMWRSYRGHVEVMENTWRTQITHLEHMDDTEYMEDTQSTLNIHKGHITMKTHRGHTELAWCQA